MAVSAGQFDARRAGLRAVHIQLASHQVGPETDAVGQLLPCYGPVGQFGTRHRPTGQHRGRDRAVGDSAGGGRKERVRRRSQRLARAVGGVGVNAPVGAHANLETQSIRVVGDLR